MLAALLVAAALQEPAQEDFPELEDLEPSPWRVALSSGMRRLEGDFGGPGETEIVQWNSVFALGYDRFDLSIMQVWLDVESRGTASASLGGFGGGGSVTGDGSASVSTSVTVRRSGWSDTYLTLGVLALDEDVSFANVHLSAGAKIPTGDEDEGLSTGERDVYAHATASRWFGEWTAVARIGRLEMSDSDTIDFRGSWTASAAAGRRLDLGDVGLVLRAWVRGQTSVTRDAHDPVEAALTADASWRRATLGIEAAVGLTNGAPDATVGVGLRLSF